MPQTSRLAALVAHLTPGEKSVRILPAGEFRATDGSGRPTDAPAWRMNADIAAALIARHAGRQSRRVVDYEHQTLRAVTNGKPAPAAGWIAGLEWREPAAALAADAEGEPGGLYATIEWTETAAAMVAAGEYRYLSPVFPYDATGAVTDIRMAGLTNDPGLDGLTDLAALSATLLQEPHPMLDNLMERLRYLLNVPLTTTPEEMAGQPASLTALIEARDAQIAALTAAAPDPALYVPVATVTALQGQVAALTGEIEGGKRRALIDAGLSDGRILPAMQAWAESLSLAALTGYLDTAQPIAALGGTQTGGAAPSGIGSGHSDTDLAVMQSLGMTPEVFASGKE